MKLTNIQYNFNEDGQTENRITPVCTGNTQYGLPLDLASRDHPRMHGQHMNIIKQFKRHKGSPPYARGTLIGTM